MLYVVVLLLPGGAQCGVVCLVVPSVVWSVWWVGLSCNYGAGKSPAKSPTRRKGKSPMQVGAMDGDDAQNEVQYGRCRQAGRMDDGAVIVQHNIIRGCKLTTEFKL